MSKNIYTVEQFNPEYAPEEMVQYVLDNVEDFGHRYSHAMRIIGRDRCSLAYADYELYRDIRNAIYDWCADHDIDYDQYDIELIFG